MSDEFKEKIRSIGQVRSGSKSVRKRTIIPDESNPKRAAGQTIEHWSGRQDAIAYPETAHVSVKVRREGNDG